MNDNREYEKQEEEALTDSAAEREEDREDIEVVHSNERDEIERFHEPIYYGGFWMRFWAYLVDLLIVSSLNGLIAGSVLAIIGLEGLTFGIYSLAGLVSALVAFSYFSIMTKIMGQTLGKLIFGLSVISVKHETLTWGDVIMREVVGRFIHRSLVITNVLYIVVGFDSRKQGIHDKFADTAVVLEPRQTRRSA
ncbi:RDD family protein [Alteribacter keqinensis]|uniref:RDD family protein n=1 Tax=Alteribacter keqinensis TaxID=2483800 RepID=A0A3M7U0Z9_9BACI|nr:RDD family protein [Alteribacter keqinensis]RNA70355.1 RDD family protein [Alteribacter keqinensis]